MHDTVSHVFISFDLKLPVDFIPQPSDGEVQSFSLQSVASVLQLIEEGGPNGFKGNIHITMLDFLIRY